MKGTAFGFGYLWLCRLHALTGAVFAAAFVLYFLVPFSSAFDGPRAFDARMLELAREPLAGAVLATFVLVPLLYHAAFGLLIVHGCQINAFRYSAYRNWMYALERVAGLLLVPFVVYHLYRTGLARALGAAPLSYDAMHALLASSWAKGLYVAGVVCAAFYIGNGLAMQATTWGIAASPRARSAAVVAGWVVTFVLAAWGVKVVLSF